MADITGLWTVPFCITCVVFSYAYVVTFKDGYDWLVAWITAAAATIVSLTAWLVWAVLA
jgi:hypothetical protein